MGERVEDVARLLHGMSRRIDDVANMPRLPWASIPADSSLDVVDPETGTPVVVIGDQWDGTVGAYPIDGPTPPVPSAPIVENGVGHLVITYDGRMASEADRFPMDGEGVEAWVRPLVGGDDTPTPVPDTEPVPDPEDDPDDPTPPEPVPDLAALPDPFPDLVGARLVATFPAAGGTTTATLPVGTWMVVLVTKSIPGKRSAPSAVTTGTVLSVVDPAIMEDLRERLDANDQELDAARGAIENLRDVRMPAAEAALDAAATWISVTGADLGTRVGQAESTLSATAQALANVEYTVTTTFPTQLAGLTDDVVAIQQQVQAIETSTGQRIIVGATAPDPADADLWIDTTSTPPVPKYHDGTDWEPLTDPDAIADALAAAKAHADALPKMLHGTTVATGSAPDGSVYFQHIGTLEGPVIAQWTRTGGAWVSTPIRSEAIANVDVGKLTAGSADIVSLVAQKIAAATGQFLELDVEQLRVTGTSVVNELVAQAIRARMVATQKFMAHEVLIGGAANLLPDSTFDPTIWGGTGSQQGEGTGYSGGHSRLVPSGSSQRGGYSGQSNPAGRFPVEPGRSYRFRVMARANTTVSPGPIRVYVRYYSTQAGDYVSGNTALVASNEAMEANTWTPIEGVWEAPEGMNWAAAGLFVQGEYGGAVRFSDPSVQLMVDYALVVDGSILARHIEASESLSAKVGQFLEVDVEQLRVTGTSHLNEAVAARLFADIFVANKITAAHADLASFAADEGFVGALRTGTLTVGGPWQASEIAPLPASKIGSGTLADARIPTLQQSKINGLPSRLNTYDVIRDRVDSWTVSGKTTINGGHIETDSIKALQIDLVDLRSVFVTADLFQGRAFIGGTFTGSTFRTGTTGQRTQFDGNGLRAWQTTTQQTVNIDGLDNWLAGTFRTARPGQPGALFTHSGQGWPFLQFAPDGADSGQNAGLLAGFAWDGVSRWDPVLKARGTFAQQSRLRYIRVDGTLTGMPGGELFSEGRWAIDHLGVGSFERVDARDGMNAGSIGLSANEATRIFFENIGGGRLRAPGVDSTTTTTAANVFVATNGVLARSSSARRYKADIAPAPEEWAERILEIDPQTWIDRGQLDAHTDGDPELRRVPGLVAEDVEAAGLDCYVTYGPDGRVEGLAYDRLWTLLIPLMRDLRARVEALEATP